MVQEKPTYVWDKGELKLNLGLGDIKELLIKEQLKFDITHLFGCEGKFIEVDVYKKPFFLKETDNEPVGYEINSDIGVKYKDGEKCIEDLINNRPEIQFMYSIQNRFINYFVSLLHNNGIYSSIIANSNEEECNNWWIGGVPRCGIDLGYGRIMGLLPDYACFLGNSYLINGCNLQKEARILSNELKLIGKVMTIVYNLFEKIYDPKFTLNDDSFLTENDTSIILNDPEIKEAYEKCRFPDSYEMHRRNVKELEIDCILIQWKLYQGELARLKHLGKREV